MTRTTTTTCDLCGLPIDTSGGYVNAAITTYSVDAFTSTTQNTLDYHPWCYQPKTMVAQPQPVPTPAPVTPVDQPVPQPLSTDPSGNISGTVTTPTV